MRGRLFEDLVVSAPPAGRLGRRAALLPLSIAAHAAALAAALLLPIMRSSTLPDPLRPSVIWEAPRPAAPPPVPEATPPPSRVTRVNTPRSLPAAPAEAVAPPPAPGPMITTAELPGLPTDVGTAPCFFNCDPEAPPDGSGDGDHQGSNAGALGVGGSPVPVGGDIKPPIRVAYVAPVYPEIARVARVSGIVVLECTIDPSGRVTDARIVTGHPLLDKAALEAVRQWRYTATRLNGVPIAVLMTVTVKFTVSR